MIYIERSATMEKRRATNSAWLAIVALGVVAAVTLAACGGKGASTTSASATTSSTSATTSSTSSGKAGIPRIERAADGVFLARVEQGHAATLKLAAEEVCKTMQLELGLQLARLGAQSGSVEMVLLQYGKGKPTERPTNAYAFAEGDFAVVSDTLSLCGVKVGSGG